MIANRRLFLASLAGATAATAMTALSPLAARPRSFFGARRKIGLQVYTLGDEAGKDVDATFAAIAAIGYREIELPGLLGKTPAALRAAADKAGLVITSIHLPAMGTMAGGAVSLVSETQRIVDDLGALGAKAAVAPIMILPDNFRDAPGASFQEKIANAIAAGNGDNWRQTAALLNEKGAALKPHGITVGYHNHNVEFGPVGAETGWDILRRECQPGLVYFEIDMGWVSAAGLDPVAFLRANRGRCRWMHVKDVKATTQTNFALRMDPAEVGSGRLDWKRIMPAASAAGVQHFYVEQEPPFTMPRIEAAAKSYGFLSKLKA